MSLLQASRHSWPLELEHARPARQIARQASAAASLGASDGPRARDGHPASAAIATNIDVANRAFEIPHVRDVIDASGSCSPTMRGAANAS
jgi:hypothetical protein